MEQVGTPSFQKVITGLTPAPELFYSGGRVALTNGHFVIVSDDGKDHPVLGQNFAKLSTLYEDTGKGISWEALYSKKVKQEHVVGDVPAPENVASNSFLTWLFDSHHEGPTIRGKNLLDMYYSEKYMRSIRPGDETVYLFPLNPQRFIAVNPGYLKLAHSLDAKVLGPGKNPSKRGCYVTGSYVFGLIFPVRMHEPEEDLDIEKLRGKELLLEAPVSAKTVCGVMNVHPSLIMAGGSSNGPTALILAEGTTNGEKELAKRRLSYLAVRTIHGSSNSSRRPRGVVRGDG